MKSIAIVGGGPGGLTLARLLQTKAIPVTVYERDINEHARVQGTTLDLHEDSGLKALKIAGLLEEFKKHYRPGADKLRITDKAATVLYDDHLSKPKEDFGSEHFRPEIDRGPLRAMLIASLTPGTIRWNAHFVGMQQENKGWRIAFADGSTAYADLVVGAEGANSKVRPYLTDIDPVYSNITMIEGLVPHAAINAPNCWELVKGGKIFALGDEKSLILGAKGDGSLSFATGVKEPEGWVEHCGIGFTDNKSVSDWFVRAFAGWSGKWLELFANDETYFIPRPMYHFPLDQQWVTQPNLTLIGDAAHRMPPYAGEGVNQAMQDALELYEALCAKEYPTTVAALQTYEQAMLARAAVVTKESIDSTVMMHSPEGLEKMLSFFS